MEPRFTRRRGEAIPRADLLAHVAAEDPVADERPQIARDRALELDREVGDAEPSVELVGRDDRAGRAGRDAAGARAAALTRERGVGIERPVHEDLAEQEPRAEPLRQHSGVLADPAEARALGPAALEDRSRVAVPQGARAGQSHPADEALERAEPVAHHAVVVLARGVARDPAETRVARRVACGVVA